MSKATYSIREAILAVADGLRDSTDHSNTTIRCALNDILDAADKGGYRVNFNYSQPKAIAAVRRLLA